MNSWREWLWIALAGAFGACARVGLSLLVHQHFGNALAWGTMSVNVLGSFAFGVIVQIGLSSNWLPDELRLALTMGFLGDFTTFSTFEYEALRMVADGGLYQAALLNVFLSVTAGFAAAWAGIVVARLLLHGRI